MATSTDGSGGRLEDLTPGAVVMGVAGAAEVTVVAVAWHGTNALTLTYRDAAGTPQDVLLYRDSEPGLRVRSASSVQAFDADAGDFRLVAEALRIRMAALFDPMLAVTTSDLEALPHQIRAVYGELIPRSPLRFLLADDPGAGKTIMAGLYIKELILRGDLARCLVVAPGGLVEQWQDELRDKFDLRFELLTSQMIEADADGNVFATHPLLIARMDQLARNEDLQERLADSDWDLVVVDEAHRMSAHYYGDELKPTKRYELGRLLGRVCRHLLLMTATPHAGKEEDFQAFLALLDGDRFEGRYDDGVHVADYSGLMRRMVKEDLLTFEGKPLFPERRASTVPYELSDAERDLYEAVTLYVREEMNRAERLDGQRKVTVGFALTVLQRRLASSPQAIWASLRRRRERLQSRRDELASGRGPITLEDRLDVLMGRATMTDPDAVDDYLDGFTGEELEAVEEDVMDAATAARTVAELDTEIRMLADLQELARQVRHSGTDCKWAELRALLCDDAAIREPDGSLRKIIIFTEHRDTLTYLSDQISTLLGRADAVVAIHGGVKREDRRKVQEAFAQDPRVQVLVATDAAGEGLNLQQSHLMVNYDLPWNPNRIEQRFGRIHRIGQTEVCHLWNLVAVDTREGAVFQRLLDKVEQQRQAYGGKVFDVLGQAFESQPLRQLLIEAVRYGDRPEVRAQLDRVIDAKIGQGLDELIAQQALDATIMGEADVHEMRLRVEQARARRLQPHYIATFFAAAFARLGGRMTAREAGRFEITHVPAVLAQRDRRTGLGAPLLQRYLRVTFELDRIRVPGAPQAELLAPGHPLLDTVIDLTIERHASVLKHGAVLVDSQDPGTTPRVMVAMTQEITDGHEPAHVVSKRFDFVELAPDGAARPCGPAPYLDYDPPDDAARRAADTVTGQGWLASGVESLAVDWSIDNSSREHLRDTQARVVPQVERTRGLVRERLVREINAWDLRAQEFADQQAAGRKVRISPDTAYRRARDLEARLEHRLGELDRDERLAPRPPVVAGGALIIPAGMLTKGAQPDARPTKDTTAVERRAVDAVLAAERRLGRTPNEMSHNNPGFDIMSETPDGPVVFIEVKGRIEGAPDVTITRNEVLVAKNKGPDHRLGLVEVSPDGPERDQVRYLVDALHDEPDPSFMITKITYDWSRLWAEGGPPC